MIRKTYTILLILLLPLFVGCAWENLPEGGVEDRFIVKFIMRMNGAMRENLFYYIVFNLSGVPGNYPQSNFEGDDRGENWNIYYMYGKPPNRPLDLYRGFGGTFKGENLIDRKPEERLFLNELTSETVVEGDHMIVVVDLTEIQNFKWFNGIINLNMIVCNQAIDEESRFEYEYDPFVYDSFYGGGIAIDLNGSADFWDEAHDPLEELPNEQEDIAPPEADIVNWRVQIISK